MTQDPYSVLGVPQTATADEIKKAYRKLVKQYHPDANPGNTAAEQKMKEINVAYDQIVNRKKTGYKQGAYEGGNASGGSGGFGRFGDFGGFENFEDLFARFYRRSGNTENESPHMQAARNYINNGSFAEALNVLNGIKERTARWYYYSAQANEGMGNKITALQHAQQAAQMEPNNQEYLMFLQNLQNPGQAYTNRGRKYGKPAVTSGALCFGFCLMNLFCTYCGKGTLCGG